MTAPLLPIARAAGCPAGHNRLCGFPTHDRAGIAPGIVARHITTSAGTKMPSEIYALIRQAILEKKQVHADHNGERREMCPHAIGRKNGREHALFYEHGGSGVERPGPPSQGTWRCVSVNALENVTIHDEPWRTAEYQATNASCFDEMDIEVSQ